MFDAPTLVYIAGIVISFIVGFAAAVICCGD